ALPSCQSPRGPYDRRILEAKGGLAMFSFEGKKALVTGGGRGIGRAIALAFARQGADVALAARGRDELDAVAGEIRALGRKAFIQGLGSGNPAHPRSSVTPPAGAPAC